MNKKTIITHKSPDLDSCVAIWLLKRFVYPNYLFEYIFVDVGKRVTSIKNTIHVDTGGIDYDHHDTNKMISAASLVYSKNKLKDMAIRKIVNYTVLVDHYKTNKKNDDFMSIVNALDGLRDNDSLCTLNSSLIMLDGIYDSIKSELTAAKEFKKGIIFNSIYGKGIGFYSGNQKLRRMAYEKGFDVYLFKDKQNNYAGFKADGHSSINFKGLYKYIKSREPEADWFLHASNQLLLCGSPKAPNKRLTKYSLNQLIEIIKEYAKK